MPNDRHVSIVQALYAAFGAGDVEALLDLLTEDVTFVLPALPGVPLKTTYEGKDGFRQFLADREPALRYTAFAPNQFFSDQDHVIVLGETEGIVIATGKPFGYRWVQLFEITREDRVSRIHEFMDTHALVSAFA
jgi:ketosteroid isomerase-like protein